MWFQVCWKSCTLASLVLMVICFSWSKFHNTIQPQKYPSGGLILCKDTIDPSYPQLMLIRQQGCFSSMNFSVQVLTPHMLQPRYKELPCFHVAWSSRILIIKQSFSSLTGLAYIYEYPKKTHSLILDQKQRKGEFKY